MAQKEAAFTALARDPDGPVAQAVFASLDGAVQALAEKGVPIAVCTSSFRESAAAVLAGTGLARLPDPPSAGATLAQRRVAPRRRGRRSDGGTRAREESERWISN